MTRIGLFIATNIAVVVVFSIVARLLGIDRTFDQQGGLDFSNLLILCALFGMGGSFLSLAISKWMALRSTGAQVIRDPRNPLEQQLLQTVSHQAQAAGIGMPDVAIYDSPEPNAFATGARRDKALVAVSTGLLRSMKREEVEAVLGHEISHVANGDMITLTLIQGIVNTFVLFLARVAAFFIDRVILKNERGPGFGYIFIALFFQVIFGILASPIVLWFSRRREFRADAGGARLAGRQGMIGALEALQRGSGQGAALPKEMAAFGISSSNRSGGLRRLFMTHPPIEERIAALRGSS